MPKSVFRFIYSGLLALAAIGMGCNIYLGYALPKVPSGSRSHMIDLGKGPKVFGTNVEYYCSEISKWVAIAAIVGGVFFIAWIRSSQAKREGLK